MLIAQNIEPKAGAHQAQKLISVAWWQRVSTLIQLWINRHQQRKALQQLDERTLKDIGVSRVDALRESYKPFWKP